MRSLFDARGKERTAAVTTAASERRTGRSFPPAAYTLISRMAPEDSEGRRPRILTASKSRSLLEPNSSFWHAP